MRRRWMVFWISVFLLAYSYVLWRASAQPETWNIPYYALSSVSRLVITYLICLAFGLTVGLYAAMNRRAGDIIIPLLDILQSVPVLGFFPFVVVIIVPVFGIAAASVVLMFTSMAWSIVFGVIAGVKAIPPHVQDMAAVFDIRGIAYVKHIALPSIYPPLIAGSILAFGSGWYFLIASEFITLGESQHTLPGLGYYLNIASFQYADIWMSLAGLMTIALVVFIIHQLVWVRLDRSAREAKFLNLHFGYEAVEPQKGAAHASVPHAHHHKVHFNRRHSHQWFFNVFRFSPTTYIILLAIFLLLGTAVMFLRGDPILVTPAGLVYALARSLLRILIAYALALTIAVLTGYLLIRRPDLRELISPLADVMQSIPALAYFPLIYLGLIAFLPIGPTLEIGSILLLMTGMLWYLLFNVIEAAQHLPKDLNRISQLYRIEGKNYIRDIMVPAMFPALVTGSILAFGHGWNAVIVSEAVNIGGEVSSIPGIGSALVQAAATPGGTSTIILLLFCMTAFVILLNHFVWRKLLNRASKYVLEED